MKLHELKLLDIYAMEKLKGIKPFEIRCNDRDFKVGDLVTYNVVETYTEPIEPYRTITRESRDIILVGYFKDRLFKITYITNYNQKDNFVVFADKEIKDER